MLIGAQRFSNPKKILTIGAVLVGAVAILLLLKAHMMRVQSEIMELRTEMSLFVSPTTDIVGDLHTLRSERYAIETRFDPLFALAGSDTDGIRKALIPLQNEASIILGAYSSDERSKIEPVLYPRAFLSLLPELEDMRRSVIRAPTPKSVRRYDALLKKTIQAYRSDVSLYKQTLADLPKDNQSTTLNYLAGTTSISLIIDKLEALDRRVLALETKRQKRYQCFTGDVSACTPLSASFATFVKADTPIESSVPPTPLSRSLVHRDIVHAAFSEMLGAQETYGVVVQLSRSDCLSGTPAAYYYFFQSREEEGVLSSTATPLNELYFYDLKRAVNAQKNPPAYLQELYDMGLRYNFQNIGNLYFCPNSGNVLSDAATLVSLHEKIKKNPLFTGRDDAYPELALLEKKFTGADIPSEEDMDRYFEAVTETLTDSGESAMDAQVGTINLFEMEEMIHEWGNRSSHFEQLLTAAHHINRLSKGIIARSKAPVYSFLTSRVYYSIFFLPFNQSVSGESFLFLDAINSHPSLLNFHLVPYSKGLRGIFDIEGVYEELHYEQKIIDDVLDVER